MWELDCHEKDFSLQARIAKGLPLPDWAEGEPPVYPGDDFLLTAFYHLSSCRQHGEGIPGPIPWDRIIQYSDRAELDEENTSYFIHIVREMDVGYLKWYERKLAAKTATDRRKPIRGGLRYKSKNRPRRR